jgi:hypothetical protein
MPKLYTDEASGEIRAALEDVVLGWPGVTSAKMFGCPSYRANGVMFAVLTDEGLVITKLSEAEREGAARDLGAEVFVGHGREIPGWRRIALGEPETLDDVWPYLSAAFENASVEASG